MTTRNRSAETHATLAPTLIATIMRAGGEPADTIMLLATVADGVLRGIERVTSEDHFDAFADTLQAVRALDDG